MKRCALLTCWILAAAFPLLAQQSVDADRRPPSVAQVTRFFDLMHIHEQMRSMLQAEQKQLNLMMHDLFAKQLPNASDSQRAAFEKLINDAMNELVTNYPIDDVLRDMVPIYQAHLSESDLNQVIDFYSSSTGQKLLKEMPAMTTEGMRVSYARLQPEMDKLIKNMQTNLAHLTEEQKPAESKAVAPATQAQ